MTEPLSVCIITKNEEANLARCLRSVRWADEIVVLDSLSSDRTCEIAREYGAIVHTQEFRNYIEQKNRALALATHDWVLCLDADEELSFALQKNLRAQLPKIQGDAEAVRFSRRTWYLGAWISYSGWYPDKKIRLFRKSLSSWGGDNPHDRVIVPPEARVLETAGDIYHYSFRGIRHHREKSLLYAQLLAQDRFARGVRSRKLSLLMAPLKQFVERFFLARGYRDGYRGIIIAAVCTEHVYRYHQHLRQLQKEETSNLHSHNSIFPEVAEQ